MQREASPGAHRDLHVLSARIAERHGLDSDLPGKQTSDKYVHHFGGNYGMSTLF